MPSPLLGGKVEVRHRLDRDGLARRLWQRALRCGQLSRRIAQGGLGRGGSHIRHLRLVGNRHRFRHRCREARLLLDGNLRRPPRRWLGWCSGCLWRSCLGLGEVRRDGSLGHGRGLRHRLECGLAALEGFSLGAAFGRGGRRGCLERGHRFANLASTRQLRQGRIFGAGQCLEDARSSQPSTAAAAACRLLVDGMRIRLLGLGFPTVCLGLGRRGDRLIEDRLRRPPRDRRDWRAARQSQVHPRLEQLDPAPEGRHLASRLAEGEQRLAVALGEVPELGEQLPEGTGLHDRLGDRRGFRGGRSRSAPIGPPRGGRSVMRHVLVGGIRRLEVDAHAAVALAAAVQHAASNELPDALLRDAEGGGRLLDRVTVHHGSDSVPRRCLTSGDVPQGLDEPIDLIEGVVVDQTDANQPARVVEPQPAHELERVVVAVPRADAARPELLGDGARMLPLQAEGEGRHSLAAAGGIGDAVEAEAGHVGQAVEDRTDEAALVAVDRRHGGAQGRPPIVGLTGAPVGAAEGGEIVERPKESGE